MSGEKKKKPVCDMCGRTKNSFGDLRVMMRRQGDAAPETKHVCAATFSCRDRAERQGFRG